MHNGEDLAECSHSYTEASHSSAFKTVLETAENDRPTVTWWRGAYWKSANAVLKVAPDDGCNSHSIKRNSLSDGHYMRGGR